MICADRGVQVWRWVSIRVHTAIILKTGLFLLLICVFLLGRAKKKAAEIRVERAYRFVCVCVFVKVWERSVS